MGIIHKWRYNIIKDMSKSIPEAQIRKAVDEVFLKYDINNDSRL